MIIVCDSSPLFALALCDKLDLLEKLYDVVLLSRKQSTLFCIGGVQTFAYRIIFTFT
jgi:predicted nucleic acid-binding protein